MARIANIERIEKGGTKWISVKVLKVRFLVGINDKK
jgi:hypothetical protein